MRNVARSHRVTYRKPGGIFRLTKIMNLHEAQVARYSQPLRVQIEALMTDVQMDCKDILETMQRHPELTRENYEFLCGKRTALHGVYSRLRTILADSKPVSADLGTVDRVGDSEGL